MKARVVAGCATILMGIVLIAMASGVGSAPEGTSQGQPTVAASRETVVVNDNGAVGLEPSAAVIVGNVLVIGGVLLLAYPRLRWFWDGNLWR